MARALPIGALFLPLAALNIRLLVENTTQYNIVALFKALSGGGDSLFGSLLGSDTLAPALPWLIAAAAGLALSVAAIAAGLALSPRESIKSLAAACWIYAGGALGAVCAAVGTAVFGGALGGAVRNLASASVGVGTYVLLALMPLNLAASFFQWRGAKEKVRLAALAAKKKRKR